MTIKVGDRVVINWDVAKYEVRDCNPVDVIGTVRIIHKGRIKPVIVDWDNGRTNGYDEQELTAVGYTKESPCAKEWEGTKVIREAYEQHKKCMGIDVDTIKIPKRKRKSFTIKYL